MQKDSGLAYEHCFCSDSIHSYLVLKLNSDIKLLNHQAEIICQNPNPAFVLFHIRREDENISIYYNITSKISLAKYLERKKLNKKELLDLLKNITKNLMLYGNYLLNLSGYVIDSDFIYINSATAEVSLIYVPILSERDTMKILSIFMKDLIVNSININNDAKDNYLQKILSYLNTEPFSLSSFYKLIAELRNSEIFYESTIESFHGYRENTANRDIVDRDNPVISNNSNKTAYVRGCKGKKILSIMLLQLFIMSAASIAYLLMMPHARGDTVSLGGVLLIAGALDVLIMKRIAIIYDVRASKGEKIQEADIQCNNAVSRHTYKDRRREAPSTVDVSKASDTIIIPEEPSDNYPYFDSVCISAGGRIIINKDKFIIGRLGSMVDHTIQGNTIGKLHAEIIVDEGSYYVKDLNSKNGTYINDVRITSNSECEIKNNDKIRFANHEYIFKSKSIDSNF